MFVTVLQLDFQRCFNKNFVGPSPTEALEVLLSSARCVMFVLRLRVFTMLS